MPRRDGGERRFYLVETAEKGLGWMRLTAKGRKIREIVATLFERHADGLESRGVIGLDGINEISNALRRMERYWTDQIRYIY